MLKRITIQANKLHILSYIRSGKSFCSQLPSSNIEKDAASKQIVQVKVQKPQKKDYFKKDELIKEVALKDDDDTNWDNKEPPPKGFWGIWGKDYIQIWILTFIFQMLFYHRKVEETLRYKPKNLN